ncbi:MAG: 16S rRNA (adenine(1518)-N(6)/adenine(1519)-N(6))-dimethyltransferase RsmA [Propionibacteriales bacterium]|nr:16S rRNA (adenine(1518)-N(6)/adenine(1519)-N(6))-dimethyltransferase RsmA [Propionibacteriales bacterium]
MTADGVSAAPRLLGPAEVRALAQRYGVRPAKHRGQNFVIDANTVRRIVRAADLRPDDVALEVGPGLGSLTLGLLGAAAVVTAVEVDAVLADALPVTIAEFAPGHVDNLRVVAADALHITELPRPVPTALVANLPYNVAVPVLLHLLAQLPSLQRILVMVQREVADRLASPAGSRVYGVPSAKAAWYGEARRVGLVGRQVFWPAPRVDSGLVALVRRPPPPSRAGRDATFAVVDAAFAQRRKMLRSALAPLAGSLAAADLALHAAGVDPRSRGEQLSIADFARVADAMRQPMP